MILPGSEHLQRYPHHGPSGTDKGIKVYGTSRGLIGGKVYKIPGWDEDRVQRLGFHTVKRGSSYIYVMSMS